MPKSFELPAREREVQCPCGGRFQGPSHGFAAFAGAHAVCGLEVPCPACDASVAVAPEPRACPRCGIRLRWFPDPAPSVM